MRYKLTVFLILVTTFECNGQLSILGDIISTARERIEGVAGAVLGGFNLNLGLNGQYRNQDVPQRRPEETIVVVVEEPDDNAYGNNHGPIHHGPPRPPHHGRPPINDGSAYYDSNPPPPPHPHHHHKPPTHYDSDPPPPHKYPNHHHRPPPNDDSNSPPPPPPHHHNRPHNDPRPDYNGQNQGQGKNNNDYGDNQNSGYQENENNFPGQNQNINGYQQNPDNTEKQQEMQENAKIPNNPSYDNPSTDYIKTPAPTISSSSPKDDETIKTTEKTDDLPLFIPLNPNEYVYGGDKINITAPKRDTEKKNPAESGDDEFDIDIRLKGE